MPRTFGAARAILDCERSTEVTRRRRAALDDPRIPPLPPTSRGTYPAEDGCPVCGGGFDNGAAYLAGGALLLSKDRQNSRHPDRLEGFLHVGFHETDPEMRDSGDIMVVDQISGGQFDLRWCSVRCTRAWWMQLLDALETDSGSEDEDA